MNLGAATRSLRVRITAVATVAVAVVLVVTGFVLVQMQRRSLVTRADEALELRAEDLSTTLADGVPDAFDPGGGRAMQLVDDRGGVVVSTPNLAGDPPMAPAPDGQRSVRSVDDLEIEDDDLFRVLSWRVDVAGEPMILHVAENVDDINDSVETLTRSLLLAFPPLIVLFSGATWWLVGRTLRPVEEAARRQEQFVSDASHELRSPLARLRTQLEVDLAHPGTRDRREATDAVLAETKAMQRLVDDLLHLARSDDGVIDRRQERVDLDDLVLDQVRSLEADGVRLDVSGVTGVELSGDPSQLARMVRNLLDNAVHHARSTVFLSLTERDGVAVLEVTDDGPGIPPERREAVFDRFVRLDDARSADHGGTGLGLAIALDIATRHGGGIEVRDGPGGGTTFVVTLSA